MEDYIYQARQYLPILFSDTESNDFLNYFEEAYIENIKNKKYEFAFKAFHILYMTFIYKVSLFIKTINNDESEEINIKIKTNNNGRNSIEEERLIINGLFEYSLLSESNVIKNLLLKKKFHPNDLTKCINHVNARNQCSHASGKIEYDKKGIDFLVSDELNYIRRLQIKVKPELKHFLENFLEMNWMKMFINGDIKKEFIKFNISKKDLETIISYELPLFLKKSDSEEIIFKKVLYLVLINEAQKYTESEKNIFLNKLPIFMDGLVKEIKINRNGEVKIVSTEEIIEERFIPIINEFNNKDREKAEKILKIQS